MGSLRIAVLFGGASSEHSISCISAAAVISALRTAGFDVIPVVISPQGTWWLYEGSVDDLHSHGGHLPTIEGGVTRVDISLDWVEPGLMIGGKRTAVDAVFPVLHGPWGEDGTVQGLLEIAGIPYVGSGVLSSAAAMDKITMNRLLHGSGLPVCDWQELAPGEGIDSIHLDMPVFVKPSRAGSSRGISRVTERAHLAAAIAEARQLDPRVIVEEAVSGAREIECAVRESIDGNVLASRCAEIIVDPAHEFYDFDAKYIESGVELRVPAELDPDVEDMIRDLAVQAFRALGCAGLARVDFFLKPDGTILVNELNTMPGFTPISMFPRMWEASGVSYPDLVRGLVMRAIAAGTELR